MRTNYDSGGQNKTEVYHEIWEHLAWKRSHQWGVSLTPNSTKTIGRMTCYCFLRSIRRDLKSSSYTIHVAEF